MFYNIACQNLQFAKNNKMRLVLYRDKFIQQFKFNEKVYSSLEKKEKLNLQFTILTDI